MKKPKSFKIVLNNLFEEANEDDEEGAETAAGAAADEKLFEMLKELRQKEAKKKNLPPFVIFLEIIIAGYGNTLSYYHCRNLKNARV